MINEVFIYINFKSLVGYFFLSLLLILSLIFLVSLTIKDYINNKYHSLVQNNSPRFKELSSLYSNYGIADIRGKKTEYLRCTSLQQFKNVDYEKHMIEYLKRSDCYDEFLDKETRIDGYLQGRKDAPDYLSEEKAKELCFPKRINCDRFHKMETDMCSQYEVSRYIIDVFIFCVEYSTPAGRKHYEDKKTYSIDEIMNLYDTIEQTETNKTRKRTVSLSQRQRILRRDMFTCQLCGARGPRAGGNAVLHVDHKLPFSKGGSDDDSNLWTLCRDCNLGKSNRFID